MPRPSSRRMPIASLSAAMLRANGPTTAPATSSNTTSGTSRRGIRPATIGAMAAISAIQNSEEAIEGTDHCRTKPTTLHTLRPVSLVEVSNAHLVMREQSHVKERP